MSRASTGPFSTTHKERIDETAQMGIQEPIQSLRRSVGARSGLRTPHADERLTTEALTSMELS